MSPKVDRRDQSIQQYISIMLSGHTSQLLIPEDPPSRAYADFLEGRPKYCTLGRGGSAAVGMVRCVWPEPNGKTLFSPPLSLTHSLTHAAEYVGGRSRQVWMTWVEMGARGEID